MFFIIANFMTFFYGYLRLEYKNVDLRQPPHKNFSVALLLSTKYHQKFNSFFKSYKVFFYKIFWLFEFLRKFIIVEHKGYAKCWACPFSSNSETFFIVQYIHCTYIVTLIVNNINLLL